MFEKEKKIKPSLSDDNTVSFKKQKDLIFFCFLSISRYFGSIEENVPYSRGSTRVCDDR